MIQIEGRKGRGEGRVVYVQHDSSELENKLDRLIRGRTYELEKRMKSKEKKARKIKIEYSDKEKYL